MLGRKTRWQKSLAASLNDIPQRCASEESYNVASKSPIRYGEPTARFRPTNTTAREFLVAISSDENLNGERLSNMSEKVPNLSTMSFHIFHMQGLRKLDLAFNVYRLSWRKTRWHFRDCFHWWRESHRPRHFVEFDGLAGINCDLNFHSNESKQAQRSERIDLKKECRKSRNRPMSPFRILQYYGKALFFAWRHSVWKWWSTWEVMRPTSSNVSRRLIPSNPPLWVVLGSGWRGYPIISHDLTSVHQRILFWWCRPSPCQGIRSDSPYSTDWQEKCTWGQKPRENEPLLRRQWQW